MGSLDEIQTALKPLKNIKKVEINLHGHFRSSLNIENKEPARHGPTVTFLTGYISQTSKLKKIKKQKQKKIWGDAHVSKFRLLKISKWSAEFNDQELYSDK